MEQKTISYNPSPSIDKEQVKHPAACHIISLITLKCSLSTYLILVQILILGSILAVTIIQITQCASPRNINSNCGG